MSETSGARAARRYQRNGTIAIWIYAAALVIGVLFFQAGDVWVRAAFMAATVLPFIWLAYEMQLYVRSIDEMQSRIELQSVAIGFGIALLIAAAWGFGEVFLILPDLSPVFLLPVATIASSFVRFILNRRLES